MIQLFFIALGFYALLIAYVGWPGAIIAVIHFWVWLVWTKE